MYVNKKKIWYKIKISLKKYDLLLSKCNKKIFFKTLYLILLSTIFFFFTVLSVWLVWVCLHSRDVYQIIIFINKSRQLFGISALFTYNSIMIYVWKSATCIYLVKSQFQQGMVCFNHYWNTTMYFILRTTLQPLL